MDSRHGERQADDVRAPVTPPESPTGAFDTVSRYYDKPVEGRTVEQPRLPLGHDTTTFLSASGRHRLPFPPALAANSAVEAVLENVKDAILTLDEKGRVLSCNTAGLKVFGYEPAEMQALSIDVLLPYKVSPRAYLDKLAVRSDDTVVDLAGEVVEARRRDGTHFTGEIAVSKVVVDEQKLYVVCLRDITERRLAEQALRESEGRYRALVENAPEAILVYDVDLGRFVDANGNAVDLFGMSRERLIQLGPKDVSPPFQPDGQPSFGVARGYIDRALDGARPVFEWLHRDAEGRELPCEVRLIRLPSSRRRLLRASITDIAERKRAEALAYGERRVLEMIASGAPISRTLSALCRVVEQVAPSVRCSIRTLAGEELTIGAAPGLPGEVRRTLDRLPVGLRGGTPGASASVDRQVVSRAIARDPLWGEYRELLSTNGLRACCSTPIRIAGGQVLGTLDVFFSEERAPRTDELDVVARLTQLAGIALKRVQDEEALRSSEARWRELFENVVDGVYQATPDGQILAANPALVKMLGYDSAEALRSAGGLGRFFVNPGDHAQLKRQLELHGEVRNFEYRLRRADGGEIVVIENTRVVRDPAGSVTAYEGTVTDITERKHAEMAVFEEKERALVTLKSIGDAVLTTDASGRVEYLNPAAEELTGWTLREAVGLPVQEIFGVRDEHAGDELANPVARCLTEGRVIQLPDTAVLVNRRGEEVALQDSSAPIRDRHGHVVGAVMVFHDLSHERRLRRQLSYEARHDRLTGLINRNEFENRLTQALEDVRERPERSHALIYIDLDQFKLINDTCGHVAGDHMLKQVSQVLLARIRSGDVLARLGGDEFAVLLRDCNVRQAIAVADDLREAVANHRCPWKERTLSATASLGVVGVTASSDDVGALLSLVDVACYAAKEDGRDRVHVCEAGDVSERQREMQWVSRITHALEDERFELYYQPIVAIGGKRDGRGHYELLLRMKDEDGRVVPPSEFIPAAERYNLMPTIDRWVVHEVLERLICRSDSQPYTLAINLSGNSLNDSRFLDHLVGELERYRPTPGTLCFEITETAAIQNLAHAARFMERLKGLGCLFSLDDFGSGLSSFTYLKNLPVDYLKIDGQFIQNVATDSVDQRMVDAINKVGQALGLMTIAERVESGEVLEKLAELGVAYAQGYHIAVPESVDSLPRTVELQLVAG